MTGRRPFTKPAYEPDPRVEGAWERLSSGEVLRSQLARDRKPSDPPPALVLAIITPDGKIGAFPPPWWVPAEEPACGEVLDVAAERTNDGIARRFVCDRVAGHETAATALPGDPVPGQHRQVTDNDAGESFAWPVDFEWPT